jgi:hypothetical protein
LLHSFPTRRSSDLKVYFLYGIIPFFIKFRLHGSQVPTVDMCNFAHLLVFNDLDNFK